MDCPKSFWANRGLTFETQAMVTKIMIAVDTNLLLYAHREDCEFHGLALNFMQQFSEGENRWSIPWPCIHEFLAITTHPRIFDPPSPSNLAFDCIGNWLQSPTCELIGEDQGYFEVLKRLSIQGKIAGPMIHDARVAAICIYNGIKELLTADRDFSRFSELKSRNPLT
tara:strand:+ start:6789 stop:7292 length:504 start_codon:yes stop_codon:yes gene_type:complete